MKTESSKTIIDGIIGIYIYTRACVHIHTRHEGVPGVIFTKKRSGMRKHISNIIANTLGLGVSD